MSARNAFPSRGTTRDMWFTVLSCLLVVQVQFCQGITDLAEVQFLHSFFEANNGTQWLWKDESLYGPQWNFSQSIGLINPCGEQWQGLSCSSTAAECADIGNTCHIQVVDLYLYGVPGPFPTGFETLSQLAKIDLEGNSLTGTIPEALYDMDTLQIIYLGKNLMHGSISSKIGQLTNLIVFELERNMFSQSLPKEVGDAVALKSLVLYSNLMTGPVPKELGNCVHLESLELDDNLFNGELADDMFALTTKLTYLDLSETFVTGSLPSSTQNLVSLNRLRLRKSHFSGFLPVNIQNLRSLSFLWIDGNFFSGSLPSTLGMLTNLEDLVLYTNYFSGTLPSEIGDLTNLINLAVNNNKMVGTLPASLGKLTNVELFWTAQNSFVGSIPNEYGNMVNLISLAMNTNRHTGTIPSSFGNCVLMDEFKLYDMRSGEGSSSGLSGSIPSQLGNMALVQTIILSDNQLTNSIPSSLGSLPYLNELDLSFNHLSGSIPLSIGTASKLESLALNSNRLTGTLPPMHIPTLINFFIQGNKLRGQVRDTFWDPQDVGLKHMDISDNLFSGELPTDIFHMPNISTFAVSGNCFSGTLPEEVCLAKKMQVLSLNGLGAARGCKDAAKSIFSKDVVLYNTMTGSLPECVWHLPELLILHATGNGLTGQIPELQNHSKLQNIIAAHNRLTGTIPRSIQERPALINLDLSFNAMRGGFSHGVLNVTADVTLEVNRLSGNLHPSNLETSGNLRILRGNIFTCGDKLPDHDADADLYRCGSEDLDISLITWLTMLGILGLTVLFAFGCAFMFFKFPGSTTTSFLYDFKETHILRRLGTLAGNRNFYSSYLQTLEGTSGALLRIFCFDKEMYFVSRSLNILAAMTILIPFPVMIIKLIDHASDDGNVMTHSHLYTWLYSMAYLTGDHTAALLVAVWFIISVIFSVILIKMQQKSYCVEEIIRSVNVDVCRPVTSASGIVEGKEWRMMGLVGLNLLIIASVNWLYLTLLSGNRLTPLLVQVLQVSLAMFKMIYSIFCVPMLCVSIKDYKKSIWVRIRIYVLNSIIVPILVAMRSNPNCIQGLFDSADPVGSEYVFEDCVSFSYSVDTGITSCTSYSHTEVSVAALVPPFLYQYQCASVVLTSYIPVFIYSYTFHLMLPFGVFLMTCIPYQSIPKILRNKFPGVFWPTFWVSNSADRLTFEESEKVEADVAGIATGRRLINIKTIVSQIMHHMCVLLTFGLCSPLLAIVVIFSIIVTSDLLRVVLARFVHYRMGLIRDVGKILAVGGQETQGDRREQGEGRCNDIKSSAVLEQSDFAINALSEEFKGTADMLMECHFPILFTSCWFFMMICFDTAGDEVGWKKALWVPIVFVSLFLVVFVICKYAKQHYVVKPPLDTRLYSVPSSANNDARITREDREVEMGEAIHNPVIGMQNEY